MRRIPQRNYKKGDCGIACVAMLTGESYRRVHQEALQLGLRSEEGDYFTRHAELRKLLARFGVGSRLRKFASMREVEPRSIVAVHPRDGGANWHWVVVAPSRSGTVILDPKPGKPARVERFSGYKGVGMYLHAC